MSSNRRLDLDLMRLTGVAIIMIAHAGPPAWLDQLRNFGTPLLIVASGLTYAVLADRRPIRTGPFLRRRISRLVLPAWLFLLAMFGALAAAAAFGGPAFPFTRAQVLGSFALDRGIGFLWIFKVYLILALLTPAALRARASSVDDRRWFAALAMAGVAYEAAMGLLAGRFTPATADLLERSVYVVVPYALLYLYGLRLERLPRRAVAGAALGGLAVFLVLAWAKAAAVGAFVPTQTAKYPPRLYYLAYAFFALNVVHLACRQAAPRLVRMHGLIGWLSSRSLWIYLWHIAAYHAWDLAGGAAAGAPWAFPVKTAWLLAAGVGAAWLQTTLVARFARADQPAGRIALALLA